MQKAKSRLKRPSKLEPIVWLTGSIVFCIYLSGYGQIKNMLDSYNSEPVVYAKELPRPTNSPTPTPTEVPSEFIPRTKTLQLIDRKPGFAGKLKERYGSEWRYAAELLARESSWNPEAINPSSGACGLVQALPCKKLVTECSLKDVDCQLDWFTKYVKNRYGTMKKAVEFHDQKNWY